MKTTRLFFLIFIVGISLSEITQGQILLGFKGGVNLSNAKFETTPGNTDYAFNYHVGLHSSVFLSSKMFLRAELVYVVKGWRLPDDAFNKDAKMKLNYINMPLLLGYNFFDRVSVFAGPELGYKLSEKRVPSDFDDNLYERLDLGIAIGASMKLTSKIAVDLRYVYGFKMLINGDLYYTDNSGNILWSYDIKDGSNRVFMLGINYIFWKSK